LRTSFYKSIVLNERINQLFKKYEEGRATAQERNLVESWYESHYGQQGKKLSRNEEGLVFDDLDQRMELMMSESVPVKRMKYQWLQVAAIFLVLCGGGWYIKIRFTAKPVLPETYTEIRSLNGVKKEVSLKDGTTVFLNSGSSVFVSSRFGERNREVKLKGEAFFKVHHDASKPFIIHSGKLQTTVLGTSFDIKAYPDDEQVKITVSTGKVKVESAGTKGKQQLYAKALTHNQALVYNTAKDSHSVRAVNADSTSSWRTNHLIFDNASYPEIIRTLSRWYDLDITVNTKPDSKRYTLSFYNERPDKIFNVLSTLTGNTYLMDGRKVIINPK